MGDLECEGSSTTAWGLFWLFFFVFRVVWTMTKQIRVNRMLERIPSARESGLSDVVAGQVLRKRHDT